MNETQGIEEAITPALTEMGYRVVRVAFLGSRRATLQIMAERVDDDAMTVEDCERISHTVSALLDVADPIGAPYVLEVSSPGIDRPLIKREDFERFSGFEAKIELSEPYAGRKRFRGKLLGVADEAISLLVDGETCQLPLGSVAKAKLILTDELIAASQPTRRAS